MAGSEFESLPSGPQGYALIGIRGCGKLHECLMDFEIVLVGEARSADTAGFDATLKLREQPDMPAHVRIGMEQIALQQETVGCVRNTSERGISKEIPAKAALPADRKIGIRRGLAERNELPRIPRIVSASRVFQEAPIFVKALIQIRRSR